MFDGNPVSRWEEVGKLGQVFPFLEHLGLTDCQVEAIPESAHDTFPRLLSLSLSNNPLKELRDVSHLSLFPALTEIRIQGTQLFPDLTGVGQDKLLTCSMLINTAALHKTSCKAMFFIE
jgi:hypothetical protein